MKMIKKRNYPGLQQEPIGEPAAIIAPRDGESLYRWIKSTGRFMPSQSDHFSDEKETNELEDILSEDEEELEVEE